MQPLTTKQRALADFIESHRRQHGSAPTYQEIADHFRFRSVNAVTSHFRLMRQKGWLESDSGKTRSLRIISPLTKLRSRIVDIPLLGAIPAGFPEDGAPEAEGCVTVDIGSVGFTPTRNTFAVRVRGVSMIGRHILDGDVVLLERGPDPRHGQVVAALVDGERTLKTYVVKNGKPYLKAENPKYPDLIPAQELVIQGVFKALIRKAGMIHVCAMSPTFWPNCIGSPIPQMLRAWPASALSARNCWVSRWSNCGRSPNGSVVIMNWRRRCGLQEFLKLASWPLSSPNRPSHPAAGQCLGQGLRVLGRL